MKPQCVDALEYMERNGSITAREAFIKLGIERLSAVIFDLKQLGYPIGGVIERGLNRKGKPVHYKRYYLSKEDPYNVI